MTVDVTRTDSLSRRVGTEIKVILVRRGMSGRRLAQLVGESQTWLSTRLAGATPIDLNDLDRIAAALEVDVIDLLPREGRTLTTAYSLTTPAAPPHAVDVRSPRSPSTRSRFRQRAAA